MPDSMSAAIASLDWSITPLGDRASWPQSLRTTVDIMVASRFAMCACWGPELTLIYNDAYAPILGARHPLALGRPLAQAWPEIWGDIEPLIQQTLAGESVSVEDMHLVMTRHGYEEDTWWSFAYNPLRDDDGEIVGFLDICTDSTAKVLNERRLETESALLRESESRLRALINATSDVVYRVSPDWQEMRQLDGVELLADADDRTVRWIDALVPEEARPMVLAEIERAIATRSAFELEHPIRRADGTTGWTWSRAVPLLDEQGAIVEWFGTASDVTGEHVSRAALAASKEKLELATRAARMGQFDYWPQTGRLEWDDRCRALFGLSPGVPVSYEGAFVAGLHPDDRRSATSAVVAALDPEGSRLFDTEYRTIGIEDGIERHIHAQGIAMFDGELPVRLIGTVQDVTADRRAQATLRETEERLRLAVRATNDAIWDWDLVRDHVQWNDALETAYGHPLATVEPSGAWWIEHIHPDDRARIYASIHAVIDGNGNDWTSEYRFRRADGRHADIKDRGYVIRDAAGVAIRMVGAMLDQTDRKEAERAFQQAQARLEETVEERTRERDQIWRSTPDLLCVATLDGWFRELNPAWQETLGWTEQELTARSFLSLVHAEDIAATRAELARLPRDETIFGFESRYRAKNGNYVWLNWNMVSRGGLIYAVVRDVTQAHEQAQALARAEEQLRQSQKMEAVGQLTGGIAHDFNNMLTGVIGSLELLSRAMASGKTERIGRYIDAATTSAQRAAGLTQRLLAFSRRQSLDVRAVDVNQAISGMEDILRRTLGEEIALDIRLAADAWNATSDANQLESALLNLAINGRDAMPHGGRLAIESGNMLIGEDGNHGFDQLEPGEYVVVRVSDTGTGMSEEVMARAFDPFFTTKPIGQGTGLGLSMIYGFMRQIGGHVQLSSRPGEGSTVSLFLRRHHGRPDDAEARAAPPEPIGRGECVMVVEDDVAVRMLVVDVLEGLGYDVIQAADGREAVAILETVPPLKLLVTDVGLPGVNGRQVAEFAREKLPGLKTLFVTGYAENAAVRSTFLDEGMDMITKPFAIDELSMKACAMIEGVSPRPL
ncbi:PAS domain-containing protein [Rhizorhabdus sp.]|uniref:PAS domain-containing protein n=1 Tax=Rhizorhabdus sp. TaxID=1968843 RepID=UPI0019C4325F|nr:PAS domain-containing protein [Rhizorhabdus sp.]MBD3761197.1 PAS domain-containing protein [Rhizorhabdus sp.]